METHTPPSHIHAYIFDHRWGYLIEDRSKNVVRVIEPTPNPYSGPDQSARNVFVMNRRAASYRIQIGQTVTEPRLQSRPGVPVALNHPSVVCLSELNGGNGF